MAASREIYHPARVASVDPPVAAYNQPCPPSPHFHGPQSPTASPNFSDHASDNSRKNSLEWIPHNLPVVPRLSHCDDIDSYDLSTSEHGKPQPLNTETSCPLRPRGCDKARCGKQASVVSSSPGEAISRQFCGPETSPSRHNRPHSNKPETNITTQPVPPQFSSQIEYDVSHQAPHRSEGGKTRLNNRIFVNGESSSSSKSQGQHSSGYKRNRQSGDSPNERKRRTTSSRNAQSSGNGQTNTNDGEVEKESEANNNNDDDSSTGEDKETPVLEIAIYACPFYKHDPKNHKKCAKRSLSAYNQVRNHIKTHNIKYRQCHRCKLTFNKKNRWSDHNEAPLCEHKDGVLELTMYRLHDEVKVKRHPGGQVLTKDERNCEKLKQMYKLLFPDDTRTPSPYTQAHDDHLALEDMKRKLGILREQFPSDLLKWRDHPHHPGKTPMKSARDLLTWKMAQVGLLDEAWLFPSPAEPLHDGQTLSDNETLNNSQNTDTFMGAQVGAQFPHDPMLSEGCLSYRPGDLSADLPISLSNYPDQPMGHTFPPGGYTGLLTFNDASASMTQQHATSHLLIHNTLNGNDSYDVPTNHNSVSIYNSGSGYSGHNVNHGNNIYDNYNGDNLQSDYSGYNGNQILNDHSSIADSSWLHPPRQSFNQDRAAYDSGYCTGSHTTEDQIGGHGCWHGQVPDTRS